MSFSVNQSTEIANNGAALQKRNFELKRNTSVAAPLLPGYPGGQPCCSCDRQYLETVAAYRLGKIHALLAVAVSVWVFCLEKLSGLLRHRTLTS